MKIRPDEYARKLAGKYALTCALAASLLTLTLPAAAQPDTPATEGAPAAADSGTEAPPAAEAAKTEGETEAPPKAEAAKPPPAKQAAPTETKVAATTEVKPPAGGAAEVEAAAAPKPPPLALELLPATAYPNDPIPGIPNGSLFLVLDRMQWPYMPRYAGPRQLRVGFSGVGWIDAANRQIKAGLVTEDNQREYRMQGRFTLRVTPVYNVEHDWFIQANAEFVANADQQHAVTTYTEVDDSWIRVGKWKVFDFQMGRMQGFEVYHFGMGLDLNTFERQGAVSFSNSPVQPYGLTDLWDRGLSNGAVAIHTYVPKWLRLEFLARLGLSGQGSDLGMRPVGVLDLGWVKLKGGYERRVQPSLFNHSKARVETQGGAAELQFVLAPWVEFGGGYGRRVLDTFTQEGAPRAADCHTTRTYGGFLNFRPYLEDTMIGFGYHYTDWENFNFDAYNKPETSNHRQMFGAVQYLLWDTLYIKYVLAYAKGHIKKRNDTDPNDMGFDNESLSHRLRLMVLF